MRVLHPNNNNIFNNIKYKGITYDIFFSADSKHPRILKRNKNCLMYKYAEGRLCVLKKSFIKKNFFIKQLSIDEHAIGNYLYSPYGKETINIFNNLRFFSQNHINTNTINKTLVYVEKDVVKSSISSCSYKYVAKNMNTFVIKKYLHSSINQYLIAFLNSTNKDEIYYFINKINETYIKDLIKKNGYD